MSVRSAKIRLFLGTCKQSRHFPPTPPQFLTIINYFLTITNFLGVLMGIDRGREPRLRLLPEAVPWADYLMVLQAIFSTIAGKSFYYGEDFMFQSLKLMFTVFELMFIAFELMFQDLVQKKSWGGGKFSWEGETFSLGGEIKYPSKRRSKTSGRREEGVVL